MEDNAVENNTVENNTEENNAVENNVAGENVTKKVLKALGILVIIFGMMGSFVLADKFGTDKEKSSYSRKNSEDTGYYFPILLSGVFVSVVNGTLLIGVSNIIGYLEKSTYLLSDIRNRQEQNTGK